MSTKRLKLGFLTIGQSPRVDVVPEVLSLIGARVDVVEAGALDGMEYEEILEKLSPGEGDVVYVSRLRDGRQVKMSKSKLIPLMQRRIQELNEAGASLIVILCSGEFPRFESKAPILYLDRVLKAFVEPLAASVRRAAVLVPLEEQVEYAKDKWGKYFPELIVKSISPYTASQEDFKSVARELSEANIELVIMDCIGYNTMQRKAVEETGALVITTRTSLARYLAEVL
ncbi:MAG: AroM family protein, partial [Desulfurococcales archaeon]|nr:AroM family protein [Desulfurococcales archaeon]